MNAEKDFLRHVGRIQRVAIERFHDFKPPCVTRIGHDRLQLEIAEADRGLRLRAERNGNSCDTAICGNRELLELPLCGIGHVIEGEGALYTGLDTRRNLMERERGIHFADADGVV